MSDKPRYFVEIVEGGERLPVGSRLGYDSLDAARKEAERHVDDALPHNYVHVYLLVGRAALGGDGETYYRDLTPQRRLALDETDAPDGIHLPALLAQKEGDQDVPCTCGKMLVVFGNRWGGISGYCSELRPGGGCGKLFYSTAKDRVTVSHLSGDWPAGEELR